METRKRVLGEEHPSTLTSITNLTSTYRNQGRWKKAEELEVQVMETRKRVLGEEHPSTLTSVANLASTYRNQRREGGRRAKFQFVVYLILFLSPILYTATALILLLEKWFQLRKKVLGIHHPYTTLSLTTLNRWQLENIEIGV